MWRVRDRATFEALRRQGRRARRGAVTVVHLAAPQLAAVAPSTSIGAEPETQVRAAFAIGRKVGNAVVRNRLRRRLRSILGELERPGSDVPDEAGRRGLDPGAYLVIVSPAATALSYDELRREVASACAATTGASGASNRSAV